jgi:hypothetical protein
VRSDIGRDVYVKGSQGTLYVVAVLTSHKLGLFRRAANETMWQVGEVFGDSIPNTLPVIIQDFFDTANENAAGGLQLLVAKEGSVEHWQRINDDILKSLPVKGGMRAWKKVGSFGKDIKHVWGFVQGSFNFALEAIVEDIKGELWH